MVSNSSILTEQLGEEESVHIEAKIGSSLQQQQELDTRAFAVECLRRRIRLSCTDMLQYRSVLRMVEYLRHRNSECWGTIGTYIPTLKMICGIKESTPDILIQNFREASEDQLEALFLSLDQHWLQHGDAPATRIVKWSVLGTFFKANGIRRVKLIDMGIRNRVVYDDEAMTQEDCRRCLEACNGPRERLLISLHIETLQRSSTINSLTWGDILEQIQKGDSLFLIKIGSKRTKENIPHWAPIGPMTTYYATEVYRRLKEKNIEPNANDPLVFNLLYKHKLRPVTQNAYFNKVTRIIERAGVRGKKQGDTPRARYLKHPHSFRKFGKIQMQNYGALDEAIEHMMGHMTSTYSKWLDRKDELTRIYVRAHPRLEEKTAAQQVIDFANSLGLSLDPNALSDMKKGRIIQVYADSRQRSEGAAGA